MLSLLLGGGDERLDPDRRASARRLTAGEEPADLEGRLAALRAQLAEERDARLALAGEVAALRSQIEMLTFGAPETLPEAAAERAPLAGAPRPDARPVGELESGGTSPTSAEGVEEEGGAPEWFDERALMEIGLDPEEARRLRARFEAHELAVLFLRDQAKREGWLRRPRYQKQLQQLRGELRADLGDDDYDAMLYAAGRNNRVVLGGVLDGSPAHAAGLRPGDSILSYGGTRIFDPLALRVATAAGKAGSMTEMRVDRDGEEYRFHLPRGPIGALLGAKRQTPDTGR